MEQLILVFPVGQCFWLSLLLDMAGMTVYTEVMLCTLILKLLPTSNALEPKP